MSDPLYDVLVANTSAARKLAPVHRGFNRYFPNAILAVAYLSRAANEKHNPNTEIGWSWNISDDHEDCVARHQLHLDHLDEFGLPHYVAVAWRSMSQLEKYLVEKYKLPLPPAAYLVPEDLSKEALEQEIVDLEKLTADQGNLMQKEAEAVTAWQTYINSEKHEDA